MSENLLLALAAIIAVGIFSQWLAWVLRLPSIILLLLAGLLLGPFTGFLDPDTLLGEFLAPLVSASIAVILFEGSLNLRLEEIRHKATLVINLVTVGALVTCVGVSVAARFLLGLSWPLAILLGSILIVSGPTVIAPLLNHVRPRKPLGPILKWESILIDPLGAICAVLVFETITHEKAGIWPALALLKTLFLGVFAGYFLARILILIMRRYLVPEYLEIPFFLMFVMVGFAATSYLQPETGLLTVTVMGAYLANQNAVSIKHVAAFKENLAIPLLANLFILLAARLDLNALKNLSLREILFLAVLIFLVRPLAVFFSSLRSGLRWQERLFLSGIAPRGIVAAAMASLFALHLKGQGFHDAEKLVTLTFLVILTTVFLNGLWARPLACLLKVCQRDPNGVLFVGAQDWAREMARALYEEGIEILLVDTNWFHIKAAEREGLPHFYASIFSDCVLEEVEFEGLGKLLALTANDEVNSLAVVHFAEIFGRKEVYQLPPSREGNGCLRATPHAKGRILFGEEIDFQYLEGLYRRGYGVRKLRLSRYFGYEKAFKCFNGMMIPLFLVSEDRKKVFVYTADYRPRPRPGQLLIVFAPLQRKI